MLGLALAGGVGLLLESGDSSFHVARDLQQKLRIPVLAEIPAILLDADRAAARRRRFRTVLAAGALTLFVLIFSSGGYFYVNVLPGWRAKNEAPAAAAPARPAASPAPPAAAPAAPAEPAAPAQPSAGGAAPATGG